MSPDLQQRSLLARRLTIALVTPVVLLVALSVVLGRQILQTTEALRWVDHTDQVLGTANGTLLQIVDQETAVRGYLLSGGDPVFRARFEQARPREGFALLRELTSDKPSQQGLFDEADRRYERWFEDVTSWIQNPDLTKARSDAATRERDALMEAIREAFRRAVAGEEDVHAQRVVQMTDAISTMRLSFVALFVAAAAVLAFVSRRQLSSAAKTFAEALAEAANAREKVETENWIRAGHVKVSSVLQGERTLQQLGADALGVLAPLAGAEVGAFFTKEATGWERRAGYALAPEATGSERFAEGEGLVGRVAQERKVLHLREVPADLLKLRSGMGETTACDVVVIPACLDEETHAVVELGFLHRADARSLELLSRVGENLALAVRSSEYKQQLRDLLDESQRQAEELQAQQEELRSTNEELEVQTTAQNTAQRQLEAQQAELEQTNDALVAQTRTLERQNQLLADAQAESAARALEVTRASQFKSDFLSNMSHELRTPLNSSLILTKLLADNAEGNLTDEQVEFARTIQGAGNDLLTLINDILDLSKIESGKMDVHSAIVPLERVRAALLRTFDPVAKDKGLGFAVTLVAPLPAAMETDAQRLEQILKNLVSNAMKFTDRGEVQVEVASSGDRITFAVRDTGVGVSLEHQELIFEAFRQSDGATNRKYGGTGLGLSISRELARLLGGDISVASEAGKGSTFTLSVPRVYAGPMPSLRAVETVPQATFPSPSRRETSPADSTDEPVVVLEPGRRIVVVVEDDEAFAEIVKSVAREAGFECLIATTADQGFRFAKKYAPIGIVLDMKLPDHTGLSLLDRLKHEPVTRHIPVHFVSAIDHTETALSMGATAYLLKPVDRSQLVEVIRTLEKRSERGVRRVLVVEDDTTLRESIVDLLRHPDVAISGAASVAEALAQLREHTFDCVVTDLGLPDESGYELLERMTTEEPYSVPPVIVYTGRALTADEEQRLRKYSRSIIVKGARSPERLLDEVTLFLHQVEAELPKDAQRALKKARHREAVFEGRTILVAEDDVRNVYALTSVLEPKGARVVIARNGKETLRAMEVEPRVDLVLMDVMMPEMDGLEATREIRKNPRWAKVPIIAITAKAMKDDLERCRAAGANDYLAKPLDVEMLLSLLRVWMPRG